MPSLVWLLKNGVIYLPKFYIDFVKTVEIDIEKTQTRRRKSLMFADGGGSLSTVVDIAGLFIEQSYCKIKSAGRKKDYRDKKLSGMVH
jgi:carboxyl-terminal processing protease